MAGPMDGVRVVELGCLDRGSCGGRHPRRLGVPTSSRSSRRAGDPARSLPTHARRRHAEQPRVRARQPQQAQHRHRSRGRRGAATWPSSCSTAPTCSSPTCAPTRWRGSAWTPTRSSPAIRAWSTATSAGYGLEGPDANRAAYDIAAFWARIRHRPPAQAARRQPPVPAWRHGRPLDRRAVRGGHRGSALLTGEDRRRSGRVVVAAQARRLHDRVRSEHGARVGPAPLDRHPGDDGQRLDQQLHGRRRPAVLDRWSGGRSALGRRWPAVSATRSGPTTRGSATPATEPSTPPS